MKQNNELKTSIFFPEVERRHHNINIDIQVLYKEKDFINYEDLKVIKGGYILSIVGDVHLGTDHSSGQCQDELKDYIMTSNFPKRIKELYNQILDIWNKYHLNDLKAGTKKQTDFLSLNVERSVDYNEKVAILKENNLYEDNGYKYGYGWLYKELKEDKIQELRNICNELNTEIKKYMEN